MDCCCIGLNVAAALLSPVCYRTIDRIDFDSVVVVAYMIAFDGAFDGFDFVSEAVPNENQIKMVKFSLRQLRLYHKEENG